MTQERRKDDKLPEGPLVFTDRNLTAAGLAHLEAEKAAACLVHAKDDVWVGVGSKDALRGLLSEDSANKAAAVDLTSPTADPAKSIGSAAFFNLLLDYADAPDISKQLEIASFVDDHIDSLLLASAAPADEAKPVAIKSTDDARKFVDEWHKKNFPTDRTFTRYIMNDPARQNPLAGDFAWQLANALAAMDSTRAAPAAQPDLIREALAVFDAMLDGCNEQKFGDFQNGHGEEIGPRMDALRAKLREATTTSQPDEARDAAALEWQIEDDEALIDLIIAWSKAEKGDAKGEAYKAIARHVAEMFKCLAPTAASPSHPDPEKQTCAWMTEDGERVVSAATKAGKVADGGASASAMKPYTVALVRAHPVQQQEQGDERAAFDAWVRRTHRRAGTNFNTAHDGTYLDNRIAAKWAAWSARAALGVRAGRGGVK